MKTAIIVGCKGQDGSIAYQLLQQEGYRVLGIDFLCVQSHGVDWQDCVDILKADEILNLLGSVNPNEVYYFAAYHHSSQDIIGDETVLLKKSLEINVLGPSFFLEGIRQLRLMTRLFYAASSLVFGDAADELQDETTPFLPNTIYGITKLDGLHLCRYYRQQYGIFAAVGILYNHESKYRTENFISKKIIRAAVNISQGKQKELVLGNLRAEVDWGYAPDYVEAMHRILTLPKADDFIVASGIKHTVEDFVRIAFDHFQLDWKLYVKESPDIMTRQRKTLVGNPGKLMRATGWSPKVDFKGMIEILLKDELGPTS